MSILHRVWTSHSKECREECRRAELGTSHIFASPRHKGTFKKVLSAADNYSTWQPFPEDAVGTVKMTQALA